MATSKPGSASSAAPPSDDQKGQKRETRADSLADELTSPVSPTTERSAANAERAMSATQAWKPALDRRQSWNNQEYKREMQMGQMGDVKKGPGFSDSQ